MTFDLFMMMVERIGIPMSILSVFATAVWVSLKWLGSQIIKPIAASHIALVNETRESNRINTDTLKTVNSLLTIHNDGLTKVVTSSLELVKLTRESTDKVDELIKSSAAGLNTLLQANTVRLETQSELNRVLLDKLIQQSKVSTSVAADTAKAVVHAAADIAAEVVKTAAEVAARE